MTVLSKNKKDKAVLITKGSNVLTKKKSVLLWKFALIAHGMKSSKVKFE